MNKREELFKTAREKIVVSDPSPVLSSLFIHHEASRGNSQYKFKMREEKTPSAYISLRNGEWKFIDFGNPDYSGSVIDIVMISLNISFYEAMLYSLRHLGYSDIAEELENYDHKSEINQNDLDLKLEELKRKNQMLLNINLKKESSSPKSKVNAVHDIKNNKEAVAFLKKRGIVKIPEEFKLIFGEYYKEDKAIKKFGVGVLTESGGADIHFLQVFGSFKTITFGAADISYFPRTNTPETAPIIIFESKMDYAAAYQQFDFENANIIIANGVSLYQKIVDLINEKGLRGKVFFFNQNDKPGYEFLKNIAEALNYSENDEIYFIHYQLVKEYKKDINDLLLDGVNLRERIKKIPLKKINEAIEFFQKNKEKLG